MINKQSATQRKSKEKFETKKFTTKKKTKSQGLQKRFALNQVREDPRIPNWFSSRAIPGFFNYTYNMTMHKPEKSATSG